MYFSAMHIDWVVPQGVPQLGGGGVKR